MYKKTMWSTPTGKLVNSENEDRSKTADIKEGKFLSVSSSWTQPNYKYYISIKPAWNQVGSDTIQMDINTH